MTTAQAQAVLEIYKAVAETIRDLSAVSPLGGVPSGELWVRVDGMLGGKMPVASWQALVETLIKAKLITNHGHLLVWIGPKA